MDVAHQISVIVKVQASIAEIEMNRVLISFETCLYNYNYRMIGS